MTSSMYNAIDYSELERRLIALERITPIDKMSKNVTRGMKVRYFKRLDLIEKIEKERGAHREVIFGDSPDVTMNPVLEPYATL